MKGLTVRREPDAASRALATDVWAFWCAVGILSFVAAGACYWFGLIDSSPLHVIEAYGGRTQDIKALPAYPAPLWFIHEMGAAASWVMLSLPWLAFVRYQVARIEAGA